MGLKDILKRIGYGARHPHLASSLFVFSHLTNAERVKLYELAKGARKALEIGSYLGASACCFGAAMKAQGYGEVYCVDTWSNEGMTEGRRDTYAEFTKNVAPFESYITPVRGYSTEVVSSVRDATDHLDVLFIDGDHSYESVKADWEAYKGLLQSGSIVIFHDYGWAEGVRRVVHEDVLPVTTKIGQLPNMWWGTVKDGAVE